MAERKPSKPSLHLTKADTVALWYAVNWTETVLREWQREGFKDDDDRAKYDAERERLLAAKRALRKVNAIRKAGVDPRQRSLL